MTIKCRSCQICKDDDSNYNGHCERISIDFTCLMCGSTNDVLHHDSDEWYSSKTFECNICHNYIKYYDNNMCPEKDEFYLEKRKIKKRNLDRIYYYDDPVIINHFEDNKTYVCFLIGSGMIELPLIEFSNFSNKNDFIKRIKSLLIFC